MITLFTAPKPFTGRFADIQRNTIRSWLRLEPRCEILLIGPDQGVAAAAKELGVRYTAHVEMNEYGTPLVNSVFAEAEKAAADEILCYANADIIFLGSLLSAIRMVENRGRFLVVGRRWDLNVPGSMTFDPGWESELTSRLRERGRLHGPSGIDYMVFRRGLWGAIPPFALGRMVWDNWLLHAALSSGVLVADATAVVTAIHQAHDYSHHPAGRLGIWHGPEATRNLELAGGLRNTATLRDVPFLLTSDGLRTRSVASRLFYRVVRSFSPRRLSELWGSLRGLGTRMAQRSDS
ncbi:MAG TPA: hypothetical protein VI007_09540 [bacterium]